MHFLQPTLENERKKREKRNTKLSLEINTLFLQNCNGGGSVLYFILLFFFNDTKQNWVQAEENKSLETEHIFFFHTF